MKIENQILLSQTLQFGIPQGRFSINKNNDLGIRLSEKAENRELVQVEKYSDIANHPEDVELAITSWEEAESLLARVAEDIAEEPEFYRHSIHKPINEQRVAALLGIN
tara:strand:- start:5605 stop:5928 length:324 start_codon:yes stop_codon:yes gene_type:complete